MSGPGYPTGASPFGAGNAAPMQGPGMTIGQILDRVFRLLRANLRLFVGLALVASAAAFVMFAITIGLGLISLIPFLHNPRAASAPQIVFAFAVPMMIGYVAMFPVFALYAAASCYAVVRTNLGGAVTFRRAWAAARERFVQYLWLFFLIVLISGAPFYLFMAIGAGAFSLIGLSHQAAAASAGLMIFLGPFFALIMICAEIYAVFAILYLSMAFPACVIERIPAVEAIRRSVALTRGAKGRIFVVLLVIYAVTYVLNLVCITALFLVGGIVAFVAIVAHLTATSPLFWFLVTPAALACAMAIFVVLISLPYAAYSTAFGVLYCDQRFRESGVLPEVPPAGEAG